MVSKRVLNEFIKKFEYCKDVDFNWNTRLFEKSDSATWSKILIQRSKDLRECYEINEENIKWLKNQLDKPLSDKEYRNIAEAALKIYMDGYDDICVFKTMLEPCIEYFKNIGDLNYLLPLIHAYCFEYEQIGADKIETPPYTYEDVLKYKDEYLNITDRNARLTIFKSYSNVISRVLNYENKGIFSRMYDLYNEALDIWNKEEVQALDGDDEEFAYFISRMFQTVVLFEDLDLLNDKEKEIYNELIKEQKKNTDSSYYSLICSIDATLRNYKGEISNEECVDELLSYFDETFRKLDLNGDPNEQEDYIDDCYNILSSLSPYLEGSRIVENKREDMIKRMNDLRIYVKSIPYTFFNSEMNHYVNMLYQKINRYMSFEEKKEFIIEVIMFRQPITCIHSLMVRSISNEIAKYLIKDRPELFIGILDTKNKCEVIEKYDSILEYIKECALYHDVGKISLVDIINTQNRRLLDLEFKKIKMHPENIKEIFNQDKDFEKYYDVMLAHHKWYNGQGGYPESFDNTKSKIKIIIDLVTIADCTDAATDILGRNYSKGKTFLTLLDELIEAKGTRYNPDIVDYIASNDKLIKSLSKLTTDGRTEIYQEVYSKYLK